jgi:hypothetical protein
LIGSLSGLHVVWQTHLPLVIFTSAIICSSLSSVLDICKNVSSLSDGNKWRSLSFGGLRDSVEADLLGVRDEGLKDGLEVVFDDGLDESLDVGLEVGPDEGLDKWLLYSSIHSC